MNFSQLLERLRLEALRRIEREILTASLLARKAGLRQPHVSNFLRNKRRLSLAALDRVLAALELSVADLVPAQPASVPRLPDNSVPLVSHESAMLDDHFRAASVLRRIQLPEGLLSGIRPEHGARPPSRDRFAAIGLTPAQAAPMIPVLRANAIVVLDRHSTMPAAASPLARPIYAVRVGRQLQFAYLSFERNFLVLRPHSLDFPIQLLPVPRSVTPSSLVVGRVCTALLPL